MEGRLDRLESEVDAEDEASEAESDESVVMEKEAYMEMAGGDEQLAEQLEARDEMIESKLSDDSTAKGMTKEIAKQGVSVAVGTAIAGSGLGAAGVAGMALATGAQAAAGGIGGYMAARSIDEGALGTFKEAKTAVTDSASAVSEYTRDTVSEYYGTGGSGEGESGGGDGVDHSDNRFS
ncbi:hypothetical protein [Halorhabdus sp. CUG00001]|uniref:hypothetical protein n=1 Tax=Halorhabdus sp. CUG00001 TaxID=2600297 RepID=UPI00131D97C7|nr:hypothetical protein [Halorhabdus sp. CUG00001]